VLGLLQRGGFGDVVDDEGGLRIAVVHGREAGEALLPGGIPNLEFDGAGREGAFLGEEGGCRCRRGRVSGWFWAGGGGRRDRAPEGHRQASRSKTMIRGWKQATT
jgi:hypothetical protein